MDEKDLRRKKTDKTVEARSSNVDRWFDAQLVRLYTDITSEPLPDELEQLVKKLAKIIPPDSTT